MEQVDWSKLSIRELVMVLKMASNEIRFREIETGVTCFSSEERDAIEQISKLMMAYG